MNKTRLKVWLSEFFAVVIFGLFIFSIAFNHNIAYASSCYLGAGFGSSDANGVYTDTGSTQVGDPIYFNGLEYLYHWNASVDAWVIHNPVENVNGTSHEYYLLGTTPVGSYTVESGSSPAGTISLTSCGGGGGSQSSTLPSYIGDLLLAGNATATVVDASNTVFQIQYLVATGTQEFLNAIINHTQQNIFNGLILFALTLICFVLYFRRR